MLTIDIRHPDVEQFIDIKKDRTKVTGANISIKVRDDFMTAVKNNEDYILRFPCEENNIEFMDGLTRKNGVGFDPIQFPPEYNKLTVYDNEDGTKLYMKRIKAKELWDKTIQAAWDSAEPGLLFIDRAIDYSPDGVYDAYRPTNTNPCGEQWLQPYDSCRLILMNLYSFVLEPFRANAQIDWQKLYEVAYEQLVLGDNLVDLEIEHVDRIIDKIKKDPEPDHVKQTELELWTKVRNEALSGRRVGAGITALADMVAALGLKYDSEEALLVIDQVMKTKMRAELDATIDMAIKRGCFKGYDSDKEFNDFGDITKGANSFYKAMLNNFPEHCSRMYQYGRRNVSFSTIAPAGSVSILTQTSSGCEPVFMPYYMRRKKINPNDKNVRVDFVDQNGDSWQEFAVLHPKFKDWYWEHQYQLVEDFGISTVDIVTNIENLSKEHLQKVFEKSPYYGSTANDIDWKRRVEIQSILQKFTTNAISSTLNLPSTITVDEVKNIYMMSWEQGLKGQTIYRDGCRTGVLVADTKNNESAFEYRDAPKRPKVLQCDPYNVVSSGENFHVFVGLFDGKPYEVFARRDDMKLDRDEPRGLLIKAAKGAYKFESERLTFENVVANMTDSQEAMTRLISTALRHGADIKFIVEQLSKTEGNLTSFSKVIARILKKYIPEGAQSTITCHDCGGHNVIFEEGCMSCKDCGSSKCG